jgi:PAS domain S-box-containing protein
VNTAATSESRPRIDPRPAPAGPRALPVYLALLTLLAGAVLTFAVWLMTARVESDFFERQTATRATNIERAIEDRLDAYISVLQAGAGLFDASDEVTYADWSAFTARLRSSPVYPGVQGVGFTVLVRTPRDAERFTHGRALRLWPESSSEQRTAIVFLQPETDRNQAALGYDMMSDTTRRVAMERARDLNEPALSGKVSLVQEITDDKQAGFLLYVPVYARDRALESIEQRREALLGFVYSPFRVEDFLRGVLGRIPNDVHLKIYDGPTPSADALLYGDEALDSTQPGERRNISLAGHEWALTVRPRISFADAYRRTSAWIVLSGTVASLLLAASVFALASGRQHARERLRLERALFEGERFAAAVIENSLDAYISIDRADRIVGWNRKAEEIFGWTAAEVRGQSLADTIVPPHLRERHVAAVKSCNLQSGKLLARRIEMPARTRSDRQIIVELSILAFQQAEQPLFVASLRDITQQREQENQLRALNENLEHVVIERTSALEHANAVLRSTNEQLDAFTRNVSHDLRAPLRAIEGYTRLAAEEGESTLTSHSRSHLKAVLRNVRRMQSIIDGLLKLAWIGQQPLHEQNVDLWKLVLDIVNELSTESSFVLRAQPESLQCTRADPLLLEHALRNLLSNAVKFSKRSEEPTVEVGMEEVDGEHRYFVKDNGVGFDPQHSDMLFQVFGRLHRQDEFEGTGIGLTIAKNVIERHGGRIWAQSAPGKGATFWFTLPKCA